MTACLHLQGFVKKVALYRGGCLRRPTKQRTPARCISLLKTETDFLSALGTAYVDKMNKH